METTRFEKDLFREQNPIEWNQYGERLIGLARMSDGTQIAFGIELQDTTYIVDWTEEYQWYNEESGQIEDFDTTTLEFSSLEEAKEFVRTF